MHPRRTDSDERDDEIARVEVSAEVAEEIRDAVAWLKQRWPGFTLRGVWSDAGRIALVRLRMLRLIAEADGLPGGGIFPLREGRVPSTRQKKEDDLQANVSILDIEDLI